MVTYSFEDKNGKTGIGRVFINIAYPIRTSNDILKVDEYLKKENEFKNVFLTNYIKLSHDKKEGYNDYI